LKKRDSVRKIIGAGKEKHGVRESKEREQGREKPRAGKENHETREWKTQDWGTGIRRRSRDWDKKEGNGPFQLH
jgi:hypothetical protein